MASFSNDVKKEIALSITDKDRRYACLYGILLYCRNLTDEHIAFTTESKEFAELFIQLVKSVFGEKVVPSVEKSGRRTGGCSYSISIEEKKQLEVIFEDYKIKPHKREINLRNIVNNSFSAFLAGVFFICGSVSDPYKEYHLEFSVPNDILSGDLCTMLEEIGIEGKKTVRKGNDILYIKDSENIEDILTFIGAQQSTINLMNIKIYKDVRNKANRLANCDTANIDKVIKAAMNQTKDIEKLKEMGLYDELPPELKEAAELRLENPDMTLQEIGEQLSKPIGRSGVARRFQKIARLAQQAGETGNHNGK